MTEVDKHLFKKLLLGESYIYGTGTKKNVLVMKVNNYSPHLCLINCPPLA